MIRTLVDEFKSGGESAVVREGKDNDGKPLPSGVYTYRIKTSEFMAAMKMLCIK